MNQPIFYYINTSAHNKGVACELTIYVSSKLREKVFVYIDIDI